MSTTTLTGHVVTVHAVRAMLDRDVSPGDLAAALTHPEQRYPGRPAPDGRPRTVHQWRDLAVITVVEHPRPVVVTVLYRGEEQWTSTDGRPSGRRISRNTRRRLEAVLRGAHSAGADTVTLGEHP
jgi:hypothetical protein